MYRRAAGCAGHYWDRRRCSAANAVHRCNFFRRSLSQVPPQDLDVAITGARRGFRGQLVDPSTPAACLAEQRLHGFDGATPKTAPEPPRRRRRGGGGGFGTASAVERRHRSSAASNERRRSASHGSEPLVGRDRTNTDTEASTVCHTVERRRPGIIDG